MAGFQTVLASPVGTLGDEMAWICTGRKGAIKLIRSQVEYLFVSRHIFTQSYSDFVALRTELVS